MAADRGDGRAARDRHVGATALAPILTGFDPNVAILMSGIGTTTSGAVVVWALLRRGGAAQ